MLFSPVNLIILRLSDVSLSSKKLKAFVYTEDDSAKGGMGVLSCTLARLDTLGSPTPLPNNQYQTKEVEPPDTSTIVLELNMTRDNRAES